MPPDKEVSRYEVNRKVRMIFARHDADLSKIDYSFMGSTVYLYGELARPDGDYSTGEIESIVREIGALPHVRDIQFELGNWVIFSSGESWQINKTRKSALVRPAAQGGAQGDSTVVVDKAEKLADVLDDIELKLKEGEEKKDKNR
ncbi:MAG TPA: hypothetical protein ENN23_01060 [Deltaproteobacteria bacterium]|nr:hypothetical protein [Deltaproteobacteria bacterium]